MATTMTPVESQRMIAVLEETIEKLSFLGSITPDVLAHRDELSALVGDEISRIISEQRTLEKRYEELIEQRGQLKGLANKSRYREVQDEIQSLSHALRESTKNLSRNLKENPNIGENLLKIANEREQLQELLSKTISELRAGRFDTLVAQVQREKEEQDKLSEIKAKEDETTSRVIQLKEDLEKERREYKKDMKEKQEEIKMLKEKLQRIKVETAIKSKCDRKEARAKTQGKQRSFRQVEDDLMSDLEALRKRKTMEEMVHKQTADYLRKQQEELSEAASTWVSRYEVETEAKETELKNLTAQRERDKALLDELQARFDREVAESAAKEAEARARAEAARLKAIEDEKRGLAATLLQRGFGKAYVLRKNFEEASKGKKGKGKGGKGKKGKKK